MHFAYTEKNYHLLDLQQMAIYRWNKIIRTQSRTDVPDLRYWYFILLLFCNQPSITTSPSPLSLQSRENVFAMLQYNNLDTKKILPKKNLWQYWYLYTLDLFCNRTNGGAVRDVFIRRLPSCVFRFLLSSYRSILLIW